MAKCQNCGAPRGYPYCNHDCREAGTAPEQPASRPASLNPIPDTTDPWATDARNYL